MAIITRSKASVNDWYKIEDVLSWQPGTHNSGLFVPVVADTGSTTLPNSIRGSGVTASAHASSTISAAGVHTVAGSGTTISLNPDVNVDSATRAIMYAFVFSKQNKLVYLSDSGGLGPVVGLNQPTVSGSDPNFGGYVTDYLFDEIWDTVDVSSEAAFNITHGAKTGNMQGCIVRMDFNYSNDLLTFTHRSGGLEQTKTDTYTIVSPGANKLELLSMNIGVQVLGAGIMQFTAEEDAAIMSDWRNVWDRMETEWLAGNRVLPREFIR